MWSRKKRLKALGLAAAGVVFGVGLEPLLDPFEGTGYAALGLALGLLTLGAIGAHFFGRRFDEIGEIDERQQAIERRASRHSHGVLTAGVGSLALILSLPWVQLPVAALLWALLVGSITVHELSIEYHRRRM